MFSRRVQLQSDWAYNRVPNEVLRGYKSDTMLGHKTYQKEIIRCESSEVSGNTKAGRPWKAVYDIALKRGVRIELNAEAIKDAMPWSAAYGVNHYSNKPFDHTIFGEEVPTYIHRAQVYRKK